MAAENMGIGIFSEYICRKNTGNIEYLKEILKYRGVFYLLNIICGFSVFGAPLAVITLLGSGLYAGMIMTVSILEFGFAGGVIGMGLLLPQYLFYIPVWLYSMEQEWKISSEIWRNRGLISGEVSIYLKKMCIAAVGYFLGILIECYVNPLIIDIILKYIKIFNDIFTIFSIGCHKISDIWYLMLKKLEIQGFFSKKGLILCKINSIIHIHFIGESTIFC